MELHEIIHEELIGWGIFLKDVPFDSLDINARIAILWMCSRIDASFIDKRGECITQKQYEGLRKRLNNLRDAQLAHRKKHET